MTNNVRSLTGRFFYGFSNHLTGMLLVALVLFGVFTVSVYRDSLAENSASSTASKSTYSSVKSFGVTYTVTRAYTSKNNVIINNLWRNNQQIAGGGYHNCALSNGGVYCWGKGGEGQLGNGFSVDSTSPVTVNSTGALSGKKVTYIASGGYHNCSVADGDAICWGNNFSGQLGNQNNIDSNVPVSAMNGTLAGHKVTQVAGGFWHSCATADSSAYCWGYGLYGQLGNSASSSTNAPVTVATAVMGGRAVVQVQAGAFHSCALAGSRVYCWGNNTYGQLGNGNNTSSNVPVDASASGLLNGKTVTRIASGYQHMCAVAEGQVYCWGRNQYGQLGVGDTNDRNTPTIVDNTTGLSGNVVSEVLNGGFGHSCAIANGVIYCWGRGDFGQLGNATYSNSLTPVLVNSDGVLSGKNTTQVVGGDLYTCGIANGRAYCWGHDYYGQLGNGNISQGNVNVPYRVNDSYY